MITPRETFKKSSLSKDWNDVVDSTRFQMGATAALVQMEIDLGLAPDIQTAAARHYEMVGAKRFLTILMGLTKDIASPPLQRSKNLQHTV